jgi:hypothetical protein
MAIIEDVRVGEEVRFNGLGPFTVQVACAQASEAPRGHWVCITHGKGFSNNMEMNAHSHARGRHRLAWICHQHGPEVP